MLLNAVDWRTPGKPGRQHFIFFLLSFRLLINSIFRIINKFNFQDFAIVATGIRKLGSFSVGWGIWDFPVNRRFPRIHWSQLCPRCTSPSLPCSYQGEVGLSYWRFWSIPCTPVSSSWFFSRSSVSCWWESALRSGSSFFYFIKS